MTRCNRGTWRPATSPGTATRLPQAWRERYGPEPTLEALLAWGKGRGEWSALEEPLVSRLLREVLEGR
ncbi:hypothetical protein [Thermus aquaticus]|uniref:Uncharacterized protein n=1 Tax=Thermus aquaticus (strain ATCC BAA-2747 / Y51MC23) TaxID=498848 RepID=A0ABM5VRH2_THEA5|nr:hypothetical protein [Thermus aquaticus]ALJ92309.1 hypothetical protein TO73_2780 [Thermus aquaticus Y51MC23]